METKQTAVEWLNQQIVDRQNGNGNSKSWDEILEQAKAMEKEQIIEAHEQAYIDMNLSFRSADRAEEYYNDTYKK